jgi:predicted extracellular nuclease
MMNRSIFVAVIIFSLLILPLSAQRTVWHNLPASIATLAKPSEITSPQVSSSLVISQFYGGGGLTGAVYNHDFVELFNRGGSTVSLSGWSVQYASSAGTNWINTPMPAASIQPGQYFLIQFDTNGSVGSALPTPDYVAPKALGQTFIANLSSTTGKVALVNSGATLPATTCPSGSPIVDFVGYGAQTARRQLR